VEGGKQDVNGEKKNNPCEKSTFRRHSEGGKGKRNLGSKTNKNGEEEIAQSSRGERRSVRSGRKGKKDAGG